ncbi:MAG: pyrroline-5-carboxylate reductase [Chitinophagaceae bacterium]|jgi:pyrroline-5-carboxylate reductase|nr:pyrroline-5-carboxylate reductase [Chitinophagaceae bacterium]
MKIAIIGAGNLGGAIAQGLLNSGFCKAADISITRRNTAQLDTFARQGCMVTSDNKAAAKNADVVVLAVKPYNYAEVLAGFKAVLQPKKHVLVSVVTGVYTDQLQKALGKSIPVIRAMPNTAIAIQQSMTCLANSGASDAQLQYVRDLFDRLGRTAVIDEKLMDAATVLGACGTAYAMRYIRANIQGGIEIGFDANTASLIAAQTVLGAAELLLKTGSHPEKEIDKVTTPRGCTIAGLNEMEHQGFSSSLIRGIVTSYEKIGK